MRIWVLRRFGPMHKAQGREIAQQLFSDGSVIKQLQVRGGVIHSACHMLPSRSFQQKKHHTDILPPSAGLDCLF
jgi:hypothetical protein